MLGRKRIEQDEELRLFIKVYDFHIIYHRLRYFNTLLKKLITFSLKNEIRCMGRKKHSSGDGNLYIGTLFSPVGRGKESTVEAGIKEGHCLPHTGR